jgi:hypothetical protein
MIGNATPTEIPNAAGLGFVLVELDLGATFCELALSTRNEENKERNTRNARKAYDSALHFLQTLSPESAEQALINEKFSRLNELFERLGVNTRQTRRSQSSEAAAGDKMTMY